MIEVGALKAAIDLLHIPSRVRNVRLAPLPDGMLTVLQIAAGDAEVQAEAAVVTERPPQVIKAAAAFFIEQILLASSSDSYRVLGARENASSAELRRNMALMLKALHPDIDENKDRSIFAGRVTRAWEDLKTSDRREAYDELLLTRASSVASGREGRSGPTQRSKLKRAMRQAGAMPLMGRTSGPYRTTEGIKRVRSGFFARAVSFILGSDKK